MPYSFHYLIMAEHSTFQKELLSRLRDTGLTIGQPKILDYLKDHNGISQKEIAKGCHIEPGTLTTLLNRMEEAGLVERRMLHGNRRSLYVFLTEKGSLLSRQVDHAFSDLEDQAFRDISSEDREESSVIADMKRFVKEHIEEKIGRNEIAEAMNFSPDYVSRIFKKETGITLTEYISRCRIERAKELIDEGQESIGMIAERLGYSSFSYFSEMFKRQTGYLPSSYRHRTE